MTIYKLERCPSTCSLPHIEPYQFAHTKCKREKTASANFSFPFFLTIKLFPIQSVFFSNFRLDATHAFGFSIRLLCHSKIFCNLFRTAKNVAHVRRAPPPDVLLLLLPNSDSAIMLWTTNTVMLFVLLIYKLGLRVPSLLRCRVAVAFVIIVVCIIFSVLFSIHIPILSPSPPPFRQEKKTQQNIIQFFFMCSARSLHRRHRSRQNSVSEKKSARCFFLFLFSRSQ